MAVFVGNRKNTTAVKCAFQINWAFLYLIKPKLEAFYSSLKNGPYRLAHCTGIDTSELLAVRAGIRNNNDLVWVGRAPNVAAKLSGIRETGYHTYISKAVFDSLADEAKFGGSARQLMWEERTWQQVTGVPILYRSSWWWSL